MFHHGPYELTLTALNLSEDLSRLSTQNDEIVCLLVELSESGDPPNLLLALDGVLSINQTITKIGNEIRKEQDLLILLVEMDTDLDPLQIGTQALTHYQHLITALDDRDYPAIESMLGDDDFLGYRIVRLGPKSEKITTSIQGIHKMDRYEYSITIQLK